MKIKEQLSPYHCIFCSAPSWKEPHKQDMPPDYCHPEDHISDDMYEEKENG